MKPRIFFIGLGNMGQPMALNLQKAGYPLVVHDLDRARAQPLQAQGAQWADSVAQGMAQADWVVCSLPGPVQVEQVILGADGVCAHLRADMVVVDTSTSSVELAQQIEAAANAKGAHYLESPITNAPDGARDPSFSLALCVKDLQLINQIAKRQGYDLVMGQHALQLFEQARDTYGPDAAELHVVKLLEERVGLMLRPPHGQAAEVDKHGT